MSRLAALVATLLLIGTGVGTAHAASAWSWPLTPDHSVTRPFGPGPTVYAAGHRGADLAGKPGQAVLAAGSGRVTYAGRLAGRGVVTVTHGPVRTTYEPVTATLQVGALVETGEPVGTLEPGHDGCPAAACLHWGLRRGDTYLDPLRLVQQGPVRLLTPGGTGIERGTTYAVTAGAGLQGQDTRPRSSDVTAAPVTATAGTARPGRQLAAGLTAGAAVLLALGSTPAMRRRERSPPYR